MICGAGTAVPCGRSACDHTPTALGGGEPMGALASSGGEEPFAEWSYVENWLAYNWSVPVSGGGGGGCEVLRRRERPFLLFDDDGRVRPILYPNLLSMPKPSPLVSCTNLVNSISKPKLSSRLRFDQTNA